MMRFFTIVVLQCLLLMPVFSQSKIAHLADDIQYGASLRGTFGAGDNAPFWFTNNRYGLGAINDNTFLGRAYMRRDVAADSTRNWRVGYGADLVVGHGNQSTFSVQQAFVEVQWKMLGIVLGQKERPSELKVAELSTGGMSLGINARPLPQVRVELPDFWCIPGTKGWLAAKGHIAYGWFTDNHWQRSFAGAHNLFTQNSYFHSKALLFRIGNVDKFPLTLTWGMEMACQFGGKGYNISGSGGKLLEQGVKLGGNVWKAFVPSGGDVNDYDAFSNAVGNHIGSWHIRLDWKARSWSVGAYVDHLFEDHSQIGMQYGFWKDMLLGVEVNLPSNRYVSTLVYEHNGTKNQSGPIYHDATVENPIQISARDNYYNHHVYGSWQHGGFLMGNPLLVSPLYNRYLGLRGNLGNYFNRVNVHHVGLRGEPFDWLSWRVLYTFERNWGCYDFPVMDPLVGHFLLLEATCRPFRMKELSVTAAYGLNRGSLLGDANGAMLTVAWDGWLKLKRNR